MPISEGMEGTYCVSVYSAGSDRSLSRSDDSYASE